MDRDAYQLMAAAERDHWWFRGRRVFIERAVRTLALPAMPRILDAGCGSGGNLALLARFGTVYGFEYDAEARAVAASLGIGTIAPGALPDDVPFPGTPFDVIGLFDVLEHLPQPVESLRALAARLAPGGALILTVPALPWLWGPHDVVHNHFRRYTAATLRAHVAEAGLRVERLTYMNALLLPLAIVQRVKERLFGYRVEALSPSPVVNRLLYRTWMLEQAWIPQRRLPIGLSLLAVLRCAERSS
ncbi:MAG: class I SAM-dependent methyltransferase [Gemmatimonas sp.]|jgi:SAM-dependent methyltransferase|uniref:class I SAM-dependent methyltransferase n=1 Tax=Gemmatimonas sp. TaxID=1962908 RepID=UPI00391F0CE8|nr:class I SAM-dependent methyltransferase [Gemmatimonadota bacterium]